MLDDVLRQRTLRTTDWESHVRQGTACKWFKQIPQDLEQNEANDPDLNGV
jgi:hypothetical protein